MKRLALTLILLVLPCVALAQTRVMQIDGGFRLAEVADVTVSSSATLVKAANGNRVTLSCTNTSTTDAVRWGGSTVTAASGQQIPAGASIEIRNVAAIYMITEGSDAVVSCTEETQ